MAVASNRQCRKVYYINGLKSQEARRNFSVELKNRFAALATLEDETDQDSDADTAKKAVGFKKKKTKKWLSAKTWDRIEATEDVKC